MLILYDLQEVLNDIDTGMLSGTHPVRPRNVANTKWKTEVVLVDDVKTILVTDRDIRDAGVDIHLPHIPGLKAGDRITVTGRIGQGVSSGSSWAIALMAPGGAHLTQHIAPTGLYALTHLLEEKELVQTLFVHTIGWGGITSPLMDFYVDSVLITRRERTLDAVTDNRTIVYSLEEDPGLQWMDADSSNVFGNTVYVLSAGMPQVSIFRRGNTNAIHVGNRVKDFDALDINLDRMELVLGNKYELTVHGRIDGEVPQGTQIMFQGIPGYTPRSQLNVVDDQEFNLVHVFSQSEVEKWSSIRIMTNDIGSNVSFYIYSIELRRIG